jgi:hypothetical protein
MLFDTIVVCFVVFVQIISGIINLLISFATTEPNEFGVPEIGFSIAGGMIFLPFSLKVRKIRKSTQKPDQETPTTHQSDQEIAENYSR